MNQFGMSDTEMAEISVRLDRLEDKIREPGFQTDQGKANEVNHWVFDYDPKYELAVRARIEAMQAKNQAKSQRFTLKVIDLYDVMITFLESKKFLEKCDSMEETKGFEKLAGAIRRALRMDDGANMLVRMLEDHAAPGTILFLTGIGACHPILSAPEIFSKVLYNLPDSMNSIPVVLFYPGTYNEQELILFNEEKEGNYYRAFRIVR